MMKFMFMVIFMIPLSLMKNMYWMLQYIYFMTVIMFLMCFSFNYLMMNISYTLGIDLLSFMMIILSLWICALMVLASEKIFKKNMYVEYFMFNMLLLMMFLYLTFSSINMWMFYMFFEASLIPTLILIMGWGYQPERIQAGVYLMMYTLFTSLPMLVSLMYMYNNSGTLIFKLVLMSDSLYLYIFINMIFFVKFPMYMFHIWLPKAHVEAPISGSMILAGVMLKLGGYGMLRFMVIFMKVNIKFNYLFIVMSLLGGMLVSFICLRQSDIKSLIAYSSIAHMSLVLSGIMTMSYWGMSGSMTMMIAHGLCSSGLFCLSNICYERLMSRSLFLNKGLMSLLPSLSMWWFLLIISSVAAPPSLNLLSEIFLLTSIVSFSFYLMIVLVMISFLSVVYSIYLYSVSQQGMFYNSLYSFYMVNIREYLLIILHWFPLNLLILKGEYLTTWM